MQRFELVIAGGGLTAARAIKSYREAGGDGRIALLSKEGVLPYHRPALSKRYLRGETGAPFAEDEAFYREHDVEVALETAVSAVDLGARSIATNGGALRFRKLLIASGATPRRLDVPGADALTGRGVYYGAALTEALSCRDEDIYLVGGGNSAGQAAVYFAQYARTVTILVRGEGLEESMSQYLIDQIHAVRNIKVLTRTRVAAVEGDGHLERVTIACGSETRTMPAGSLFVFIGAVPRTDWLGDLVQRDEFGFILTGPDLPRVDGHVKGWTLTRDPYLLETNVPGILCAGDVRHQSVKRVASAVGEGSIAVQFTHRYLADT